MNKINALLLVTAIIVSAGAGAGYQGRMGDRMHEYWNMKMGQWTTAIEKQDAKTKAEAQKLLTQVEAKHDAMVAEWKKIDQEKIKNLRKDKHALMNKLDKMLGLKTTREKIHEKAREIKTKIQNKFARPVVVTETKSVQVERPIMVKQPTTVTIVAEEADMTPVVVKS